MILRPLRWRDLFWIKRLASDPEVRAASFDPRPPNWPRHLRYAARMIRERREWVAEAAQGSGWVRIGVVIARLAGEASMEIGVSLAREFRGLGLGRDLILAGTRMLRERWPRRPVVARIKAANVRSLRAFEAAGYRRTNREGDWWTLAVPAARPAGTEAEEYQT